MLESDKLHTDEEEDAQHVQDKKEAAGGKDGGAAKADPGNEEKPEPQVSQRAYVRNSNRLFGGPHTPRR